MEKMSEIPWISFPSDWKVQIIPPFCGAIARFRVELPDGRTKSIYLDYFDRLGSFGQPYWECYPCDGDTFRCAMDETDELLKAIASPGSMKITF